MQVGGDGYSEETARSVRSIGVVITPILALYSLLVVLGVVSSDHYVNLPITIAIIVPWVLLSVWFYFFPTKEKWHDALRLAVFHFFALLLFIFVLGYAQPFAPLYALLLIASQMLFGGKGLALSTITWVAGVSFDTILRAGTIPDLLFQNGITAFSVIFLGYSVIGIVSAQETKRKALLHSQQRERLQYDRILTIMNNLTDAAFTTDEKGSILMYNAACLDLLDTNDSLKGKNIGELFNLTDKDTKAVNLLSLLKHASRADRRDDLNHTYTDGEAIRLEISFSPIRSNFSLTKKRDELGGYILIMRDVTKQKSLEEERDEFISVVSHELRTPITIVEGTLSNLEVILERTKDPSPKMIASNITTAHDQVLYLAKMVNDLSTLSRAERGVADTAEEIDVQATLHELHHRYEKEAEARHLHLNLDLGPKLGTINVSRLYFEELLQNFITNAIKYTKEGSVTIGARKSKGVVRFTVTDTGIGISRSDQNKVFSKFYRSEDYRIRETNGTGLGLYVANKLAHKLHTRIELKSRINHGSAFSFELPSAE